MTVSKSMEKWKWNELLREIWRDFHTLNVGSVYSAIKNVNFVYIK